MVNIVSMGGLLWWAIALALTNPTFASSPIYITMRRIMSEPGWAIMAALIFALYVYALIRDNRTACLVAHSTTGIFWWIIAGGLFYAAPTATGVGIYAKHGVSQSVQFGHVWARR